MTQKKIDKANNFDKADLPNFSKIFKNNKRIPLVTSYNWTSPNVTKIMQKDWPILQINKTKKILYKYFDNITKKSEKPSGRPKWKHLVHEIGK